MIGAGFHIEKLCHHTKAHSEAISGTLGGTFNDRCHQGIPYDNANIHTSGGGMPKMSTNSGGSIVSGLVSPHCGLTRWWVA